MSFQYTAINFDHNVAFPGVETVRTMSNAMVERGELASTVLRVLDTLEEGQGYTVAFNYLHDGHGGALNVVETAFDHGEGYAVATHEIARIKVTNGIGFKSLMGAIDEHAKNIAMASAVGLWSDPDTGEIVLDAAWVVRSRELAEAVGHDHKQHSIYDIINEKEIIL